MALFDKSSVKQSASVAKHRSTMGMLLNLDIAASINPLRDTVRMFVNLLAMIFAASGMFPRNHPAFTQDSVHLGLGEVMSRAWSSLRPSVADIPRYLLFFGVLSSIVFCGGAIIIIAFSLLLGQAHADTTDTTSTSSNTFFSPVDDSHDLALAWVRFIFQGQPVYNYLSYGQVVPQLVNVQAALLKALAFYADAILVVAAFILFYHLTTMIISTAHHGEIMGKKADKVWAPIRLVIALGLLVPVAGGLSSGQMIVIKVSEWGSNLASQTWKIFMDALVKEDQNPINAYAPSAKKVVADTMMTYACQQAYVALTQQFTSSAGCQATNAPPPLNTIDQQNGMPNEPAMGAQVVTLANGVTVNYTGFANTADNAGLGASASGSNHTEIADNAMCGAWSTPPASSDTLGKQLDPLRSQLYGTMQTQAKSTVDKYLQYFIPANVGGCYGQQKPPSSGNPGKDFTDVVSAYESSIASSFNSTRQNGTYAQMMQAVAQQSSAQGWVSAGSWFNTIARIEGESARISELLPGTQGPNITEQNSKLALEMKSILDDFQDYMNMPNLTTQGADQTTSVTTLQSVAASATDTQKEDAANAQGGATNAPDNFYDKFFAVMDWYAAKYGVWKTAVCTNSSSGSANCTGTAGDVSQLSNMNYDASSNYLASNLTGGQPSLLGMTFTNANPLAQIVDFGQRNMTTSAALFDEMIHFLGAGGVASMGKGLSELLTKIPWIGKVFNITKAGAQVIEGLLVTISGLVGMVSMVFFTCGFMLTFFLPMIPFMRFFFRSVAWFLAVLEAVIAIPLVALAHLNPEGEGLPGSAKHAYQMVFSIFLNPIMMIFGLIVGLLIFSAAAGLLNLLYLQAVVGVGGTAHHGYIFMSRFVYTVLYVLMLYIAANSAFKMISLMPDQASKWLNIQGIDLKELGDPDNIGQQLTYFSTLTENKIIGQVGQLRGPQATVMSEMLAPGSTKKATEESAALITNPELAKAVGRSGVGSLEGAAGGLGVPQDKINQANQMFAQGQKEFKEGVGKVGQALGFGGPKPANPAKPGTDPAKPAQQPPPKKS